jgi:hypothetical protein
LVALSPKFVSSGRSLKSPISPRGIIVSLVSSASVLVIEVYAGVSEQIFEGEGLAQENQGEKNGNLRNHNQNRLIIYIWGILRFNLH